MIWDVEVHVKWTELFKLQLVDHRARFVRQLSVQCFGHLSLNIFQFPYYLSLAGIKLGYSVFLANRVELGRWLLGRSGGRKIGASDVLPKRSKILDRTPTRITFAASLLHEYTLHIFWNSKGESKSFTSKIGRQFVEHFEVQLQLAILLVDCKRGV